VEELPAVLWTLAVLGVRLLALDYRLVSHQARWITVTGEPAAPAAAPQEAAEKQLHQDIRILSGPEARMLCAETFRTRCGRRSGATLPSSVLSGFRAPSMCVRSVRKGTLPPPEQEQDTLNSVQASAPDTTKSWWQSMDNTS